MTNSIMNPWNFPYLCKLAEQFGLKKVMDLHAYLITHETPISERHVRIVERIKTRSHITIRSLDYSKYDEEIILIRSS